MKNKPEPEPEPTNWASCKRKSEEARWENFKHCSLQPHSASVRLLAQGQAFVTSRMLLDQTHIVNKQA